MLKIKAGDYIRTKDGVIAKITDIIADYSIDCDRDVYDLNNLAMMEIPYYFKDEYIVKSSPNIIDLIEVGDYVNGYLVIERDINNELRYIDLKDRNMKYVKNLDIKSIVTKEQFNLNKFDV